MEFPAVLRVFLNLACSPDEYCKFISSDLPGNLALKNGWGILGEFSAVSLSQALKHEDSLKHSGQI